MSLETGGRADKLGNAYENRFLAKLFIQLLDEKIEAVIVEPVGNESKGVEFIAISKNKKTYYQCKASNAMQDHWRISDLKKHNIFEVSKKLIEQDPASEYKFISPLQYTGLSELCNRARTNSSPEDFLNYQQTNKQFKNIFRECAVAYNLMPLEKPENLRKIVFLLTKSYFETVPNGSEAESDFDMLISGKLTGPPQATRILLEQYANSNRRFGVKITSTEIVHYLEDNGIRLRNLLGDKRVKERINTLNELYKNGYKYINDYLIHRKESDEIISKIKSGKSVIIYGKAGTGKSGCIHEIIKYLETAYILYLAIRLDKKIPNKSADNFGKDLDLPESPVFCLRDLSAGERCVLILDQLDSLRWTNLHSRDALEVCKEIIMEVENINQTNQGQISLIFVSRTFDLETDAGIKSLFERQYEKKKILWEKVCIDLLSQNEVAGIIGEEYNSLSSRLKKLLQTPSSLFIWNHLDKGKKQNKIKSLYELMKEWESQILNECEKYYLEGCVYNCVNKIITTIDKTQHYALPKSIFIENRKIIEKLISSGLLSRSSNTISFTHQNFLDYFTARDIIRGLYSEGKNILDYIGSSDNQTPEFRYRFLFVMQTLMDDDLEMFLIQACNILDSTEVRYYYKCAIFDVIGQNESPNNNIYEFIMKYYEKEDWNEYIYRTVFAGHSPFIKLMQNNRQTNWLQECNIFLLKSINETDPDFIETIIKKHIFQNEETDKKLYGILSFNPANDSDSLFKLRMKLYEHYPLLLNGSYTCSYLIPEKPERAIQMLAFMLEHIDGTHYNDSYISNEKDLKIFLKLYYKDFVEKIFPLICKNSSILPEPFSPYFYTQYAQVEKWSVQQYSQSFERNVVQIMKSAIEEYAKRNSKEFIAFINNINFVIPNVGYEIILHGLLNLPEVCSNFVLSWLIKDFKSKIFIYTFHKDDYLYYTKKIIKNFSSSCDIDIFKELEKIIYRWQENKERMKRLYSSRQSQKVSRRKQYLYYPFWGIMQKELLQMMAHDRLSDESKNLIKVLNRNIWIKSSAYSAGTDFVKTSIIQSPIDSHLEKISDKAWLKILTSPIPLRCRSKNANNCFIETDTESFARSLYAQAIKQQNRFAMLSLSFPENIYEGYIIAVLNSLSSTEELELNENIIIQCVRKFSICKNNDIALALIRLINKYHKIDYPDDILTLLERYAEDYPDYTKPQYMIGTTSELDNIPFLELTTRALNGVQSFALMTIALIINYHTETMERFKPLIMKSCENNDTAILLSVLHCVNVYAYHESDYDFAIAILKRVLAQTKNITISREFWNVLVKDYPNDRDYYRNIIMQGCKSINKELANSSAESLCAIAIYFDDTKAFSYLRNNHFSEALEDKICNQAIFSFDNEEYHDNSVKILNHFIQNSKNKLDSLRHLFNSHDKKIAFERDYDLIMKIINSPQITELAYYIVKYTIDTEEFHVNIQLLESLFERVFEEQEIWRQNDTITYLVRCLLSSLDKNKDNAETKNKCLNMWDILYKKNCMSIRGVSNLIEEITDK